MDARQFSESLSSLSSRFVKEYTRNAEQYARVVAGMKPSGSADVAPDQLQQRYSEFLRTEGLQTLGKLAEAGLQFYSQVLQVGADATNRFFEQVLLAASPQADTAPAGGPAAPPAAKSPPVLLFRGKPGDSPTNAFVVSNNTNESVDVSFEVSELVSDDKSHRFSPTAQFTPERFELGPNSEQIVQCAIPLSEEFSAGQMHHASIRVVGFPDMTMEVSAYVDETKAPRKAAKPTPRKKRAAKPTTRKKKAAKKRTAKASVTAKKVARKKRS